MKYSRKTNFWFIVFVSIFTLINFSMVMYFILTFD